MLQTDLMSVYVSQVINDVDGDNIPDILAVHGGDELSDPEQEEKMFGRLIVFSGKDGKILRYVQCFYNISSLGLSIIHKYPITHQQILFQFQLDAIPRSKRDLLPTSNFVWSRWRTICFIWYRRQ